MSGSLIQLTRPTSPSRAAAFLAASLLSCCASSCDDAEARPAVLGASLPRAAPEPFASKPEPEPPVLPAREHVDFVAANDPPATPPNDGPRLYAKTRFVWVRTRPDWSSEWIGYLWHGSSVRLRSPGPVYGRGCGTWYAVVPRGYVCVDGKRATLDEKDAQYAEIAEHAPNYDSASPHHYAESLGAERYEALPEEDEQHAREPDLEQHLGLVERARRGGRIDPTISGVDLSPAGTDAVDFASLPVEIQIQRRSFRRDSTVAYVGEFLHGERSFLLTSDFAWIPKDRVRPYAPILFHGIALGGDVTLPMALFREHERPSYRRTESGVFERVTETFPRLGWVGLTGRSEIRYPATYLETAKDGLWVLASDAVVPTPSTHTPWGARVGSPDTNSIKPPGRATWVEASVYNGWLIAYEDTVPVLVTLIAAGRGGVATPPQDPTKTSATPTGRFLVTGKFLTATMDGSDEVTHADVPWVQNFSGPHSIHAAYWHDAWGERVSGGCLNVSPADGRWLFAFTEPKVPDGWHGVRWDPRLEPATIILIHP
jgi:lipoprotein-anchoring transpeptidase ErfK/SrfK